MSSKRNQIRVGIFALTTLALAAIVIITFGGVHIFAHEKHYTVEVRDSVLGLESGASVYFNGIEVGSVDRIAVSPNDLASVLVSLSVAEDTPVHTDTVAFVSMAGLTGLKTIDLKGGKATTPSLPSGGMLAAGQGPLDKLEAKAEELADQSGKLMVRATQIVDGTQRVIANLQSVTDPRPIAAIVASTKEATGTLASASHGIAAMIEEDRSSLHAALESLTTTTKSAQALVANQVTTLVGNANDLVLDLRGVVHGDETEMNAAMRNLRQASRSFEELARELRDRPSRLLFSSTPSDRKLP